MKSSQPTSPQSGFTRIRMATGVLAAVGIAGTIGGSVLAYSDTTSTTTANTSDSSDITTAPNTSAATGDATAPTAASDPATATDPNAAVAPTAAATAPSVTSGSGQSQATSGGS